MTEINEMLTERGTTHGDYSLQAGCANAIKCAMHQSPTWKDMPPAFTESLDMIAVKLSRILTGDSDFRDHWDDIAGYAKLAADRCSK